METQFSQLLKQSESQQEYDQVYDLQSLSNFSVAESELSCDEQELKNIFRIERNARQSQQSQRNDQIHKENQGSLEFKQKLLKINYNRKEKSLEELSKKFLVLFIEKDECIISLEQITSTLGVERRRIYDIINILESLKLVSRRGKNNYKWNGFQKIFQTIHEFETQTESEQDSSQVLQPIHPLIKREKSLEMLSIGFLKLFLNFKKTMSLEEGARKLSNIQIDDHKIKTKIRRLYDIANVFKSMGLIKKTTMENKKPGFQWIGLQGVQNFVNKIRQENKLQMHHTQNVSTLLKNLQQLQEIPVNSSNKQMHQNYNNIIQYILMNMNINAQEEKEDIKQYLMNSQEKKSIFDSADKENNQARQKYVTPIIKKSTTIICHINDNEEDATIEKKALYSQNSNINQDTILKDSTNLLKRRNSLFDVSSRSSFKKIKKLDDDQQESLQQNINIQNNLLVTINSI